MQLDTQLSRAFSRLHNAKSVVPRRTEGVLDVLVAPYYGPLDGKDAHGQFFSPNTNFMSDVIPHPGVFHFHGSETGSNAYEIGKSGERWDDDLGLWQTVTLDLTKPEGRDIWDASLAGRAFASTGAVPASILYNFETGEIEQWLIGEISLMALDAENGVAPANTYAIALPRIKALRDEVPEASRKLFDNVYLVDDAEGDIDMEKLEELTAVLANLVTKLSELLGVSVDEAANVVEEAASDAADMATSDMETDATDVDCADCAAAADALLDALDIGEDEMKNANSKSVLQLRKENAALRAKLARQNDEAWVGQHIKAGRVSPAEKNTVLAALTQARKAQTPAALNAVKAMIANRPVSTGQRSTVKSSGLKSLNFQTSDKGVVDSDTVARMRRYAGVEEEK